MSKQSLYTTCIRSPYASTRTGVLRQQAIVFVLDDRVAFAGALRESRPVEDGDAATPIVDEPGLVQVPSRHGDPLASNAHHVGYQFLRHVQLIGVQAVQTQ